MRLRASYGTAGLRPEFDYQYEILDVNPGGFTPNILGNPLLKPAHSDETEVGTNHEFGSGRFTLEYTYANKKTSDQILLVDLPAVTGFKRQWQNTGALRSRTHELTFESRLVNRATTSLTLNIVGDRTRQVITSWTLPERLYGLGFTYHRLTVNALTDWSYGGDLYNGTRQWAFQATRDRVQDQSAKPQNAANCGVVADPMPSCPRKALGYYGVGFYNGLDPDDFFVDPGSYAKLKELSNHYTFSHNQLRAVGLSSLGEAHLGFVGRNLFRITKYSGL